MVFRDRDDVARTGGLEQRGPCRRVEALGREFRNEVLVAEGGLRSERLDVMVELRRRLVVHVARVPLVPEGRHGVDAPVNEDAELAVFVPRGNGEAFQRTPRRSERALRDDVVDGTDDLGDPRIE